ncbi:S phase cyclin A-associated protein in the endoplasmic reticulum-like protein [Drosera capensis]
MENGGEGGDGGDDHGSGWFEVKKKHRSSSKFSVQYWAPGSSRRHVNEKSGSFQGKRGNHLSLSRRDPPAQVQAGVINQHPVCKGNEEKGFRDKCVVNEDKGNPKTPEVAALVLNDTTCRTATVNEDSSKNKPDMPPKIKWGDLEDDAYLTKLKNPVSEIKFGEIGDDDLAMCRISKNVNDLASHSPPYKCTESQKSAVKVIETVCEARDECSTLPVSGPSEVNCGEVNEALLSCKEDAVTVVETVHPSDHTPDHTDPPHDDTRPINSDYLCASSPSCDISLPSVEEAVTGMELRAQITSTLDPMEASDAIATDSHLIVAPADQVMEAGVSGDGVPKVHEDSCKTQGVEECSILQSGSADLSTKPVTEDDMSLPNENIPDNDSRAHVINSLAEREEGESKERFRERLWCFLFENLNRAIDELYLLCELECDFEQIKEAILVLEEAAFDFKELNIRVQEFEKLKRNSSKLMDGTMNVKADHRRPHALSWEVRRMTTSPQRAEILSSSLEAFKKIQQERVNNHPAGGANAAVTQRHSRKSLSLSVSDRHSPSGASGSGSKSRKQNTGFDSSKVSSSREKRNTESGRSTKSSLARSNRFLTQSSSSSDLNIPKLPTKDSSPAVGGKGKKEQLGSSVEEDNAGNLVDQLKRKNAMDDRSKEKERRSSKSWKSMDAWKEKRNWEEILASPFWVSSRVSHSPSMGRRSADKTRNLHDKLMSPEKKRKTAIDLKKEAEEKHARAMRIRNELENERVQKLQRTSEKLNRVNEWQAVRSMKLKEGLYARHQRSESRHEAHIAQVIKRAGDESTKVNEVRFITSLNEESKKFILRQKHQDSEMRRAEKLQVMKTKQKEDMAREEAVLERKKVLDAEKMQRLAETQRKKEEAQARREEERKASSAAREAKALEQLRRKEERAKAQQEEAELLAQKLAERLRESEQRRKLYLEQIRERASVRDQTSPLQRRLLNKDGPSRQTITNNGEDNQLIDASGSGDSRLATDNAEAQKSVKRKIRRIRQRLMALKHGLSEPTCGENSGIGYKTAMATAKAKLGRWLQDLQRYRQQRKEGASSIGLITAEMIKFLEGKDLELQAARHGGVLDFISSALPASHISTPEACQVTIYLLKLLKVLLSVPRNRNYFLAQNLLPPAIPMLSAALESYIKIAASLFSPVSSNLPSSKTSSESFDSMSEVVDGFLWTVTMIIGQETSDERDLQMQDGLLELVISYQVIHRLRDLFALYDRPQAEGSPFPSAIVLGINLLEALTSRPRAISCIEWEAFPVTSSLQENEAAYAPTKANPDSVNCISCDLGKEPESSESVQNGSSQYDVVPGQSHTSQNDKCGMPAAVASQQNPTLNPIEINVPHLIESIQTSSRLCEMTDRAVEADKNERSLSSKVPLTFLLATIAETGLVSLLSLLTAALLQASNRSSSEQASYVLPTNFEEVASGVLKVLNNMALMDISFMQQMLARPDLKMEFFHIMSFLLAHCSTNWKVAGDKVGLLMLESLFLVGHFSLLYPENQAICDLPFVFFSDPELMPILGGAIIAACYGCEQNKVVVQQELSTEMLLSLVKSCRNRSSPAIRSLSPPFLRQRDDSVDGTLSISEPRKPQAEASSKGGRANGRASRASLLKPAALGNSRRVGKLRNLTESRLTRSNGEVNLKQKETSVGAAAASPMMLHSRFPGSFIERAEQFFITVLAVNEDGIHA